MKSAGIDPRLSEREKELRTSAPCLNKTTYLCSKSTDGYIFTKVDLSTLAHLLDQLYSIPQLRRGYKITVFITFILDKIVVEQTARIKPRLSECKNEMLTSAASLKKYFKSPREHLQSFTDPAWPKTSDYIINLYLPNSTQM